MSDMKKNLKNKRIRKYTLIGIVVIAIIGTAIGLKLEGKDEILPDGQGNVITTEDGATSSQVEDDNKKQDKVSKEKKEKKDKKQKENKKTKEDKISKQKKSKAKAKAEKQAKKLSKLSDKEKEKIKPKDVKVDNKEDFTASNDGNRALRPKEPKPVTVTLEIRCDTLSSDMSKLENESIREYIPKDGTILKKSEYKGTTENTVFDALNTLTRNNGIHMECKYTPIFQSNYIEGINFLYEFDGGPQSGWMYSVNGWFPNYGCSNYYLSDGDVILWCYTCRGLGADVGEVFEG